MVNFLISDIMDKIQETRSKNQKNKIQDPRTKEKIQETKMPGKFKKEK